MFGQEASGASRVGVYRPPQHAILVRLPRLREDMSGNSSLGFFDRALRRQPSSASVRRKLVKSRQEGEWLATILHGIKGHAQRPTFLINDDLLLLHLAALPLLPQLPRLLPLRLLSL